MDNPIKWQDSYIETKHRTILTIDQIKIPGVRLFGKHNMSCAISPLSTHYHEDAFEFVIVSEGSFEFTVGDEKYNVSGGDVFISYPNEIHSTAQSPLSLGEFYWLQLDISVIDHFLFLTKDARDYLINELNNLTTHTIQTENTELITLCKETFKLAYSENQTYLIASYLVFLIHNILKDSKKSSSIVTEDIKKSIEYIKENITNNIMLEDLAHAINLSLSHFKQKFKKQLGVSPRNYINIQKIDLAKELLKQGKSKTDIAMLLGFNTSSYFSSVFKKYTTQTPSEFSSLSNQ